MPHVLTGAPGDPLTARESIPFDLLHKVPLVVPGRPYAFHSVLDSLHFAIEKLSYAGYHGAQIPKPVESTASIPHQLDAMHDGFPQLALVGGFGSTPGRYLTQCAKTPLTQAVFCIDAAN
jgi:hypothetical protein